MDDLEPNLEYIIAHFTPPPPNVNRTFHIPEMWRILQKHPSGSIKRAKKIANFYDKDIAEFACGQLNALY